LSSGDRFSVPLLAQLIPDGIKAGTEFAVEFDPSSQWIAVATTIAARYIQAGGRVTYVTTTRSPETAKDALSSLGVNVSVVIREGHLTIDDWYTATQLSVFAWQALAGGFFAGMEDEAVERVYGGGPNHERLARARTVAARHDATPTQVALAWVLARPYPVYAIVGPRSIQELEECTDALELDLTQDELAWLDLQTDVLP